MKHLTLHWLFTLGCALAIAPLSWAEMADDGELNSSDLSYSAYINSDKRIKCLYGYAADKTGDHQAAIAIFEDCIARWNDVYSMLWLAQIYEAGVAVKQDLTKSTQLMKRGAEENDEAGYSSLARFHYGVALFEGIGTNVDRKQARIYLQKAAKEGIGEACDYLKKKHLTCS